MEKFFIPFLYLDEISFETFLALCALAYFFLSLQTGVPVGKGVSKA